MIRAAGPDDAAAIAAIETSCFEAGAWSEALLREHLGRDHHVVLVDGDLRAYGAISVSGEVADLDRVAVVPAARRQRLAAGLLVALIDRARGLGADRMLLEVSVDNAPAHNLYRTFGFDTISRRNGYYPGRVDALVMKLDIKEA